MRRTLCAILIMHLSATSAAAQDAAAGELLYGQFCATCHGMRGEGNGPMAPVLLVQPSDLTSMTERYGEFPLLRITSRIDGRDPLVSHGSDMPIWGWFFDGEAAAMKTESGQPILTTAPIVDLVAYLATLQD